MATILWAMADDDGLCPGQVGPCMHFLHLSQHEDHDVAPNKALQSVTNAYNRLVRACEKAAAKRNRDKDADRTWKVALLMTDRGTRFAFTYGEGKHEHVDIRQTLLKVGRPGKPAGKPAATMAAARRTTGARRRP